MFKKLLIATTLIIHTHTLHYEEAYIPEILTVILGGAIITNDALKCLNYMYKDMNWFSEKTYKRINTYINYRAALTIVSGLALASQKYDIDNYTTNISLVYATWALAILGVDGSAALLSLLEASHIRYR